MLGRYGEKFRRADYSGFAKLVEMTVHIFTHTHSTSKSLDTTPFKLMGGCVQTGTIRVEECTGGTISKRYETTRWCQGRV